MTTWGTEEDFKHFLPRLLELVTAEESITDVVDSEVLLGKLAYADWTHWPSEEQKAVNDYLNALWLHLHRSHLNQWQHRYPTERHAQHHPWRFHQRLLRGCGYRCGREADLNLG